MNNNPILPNGQDFNETQLDALEKIQKRALEEMNELKKDMPSDPRFPHSAEHLVGFMGQALATIRAYKKKFPKGPGGQPAEPKAEVEKDAYRES